MDDHRLLAFARSVTFTKVKSVRSSIYQRQKSQIWRTPKVYDHPFTNLKSKIIRLPTSKVYGYPFTNVKSVRSSIYQRQKSQIWRTPKVYDHPFTNLKSKI